MVSHLIVERLMAGSPEGVISIVLANLDNNLIGYTALDNKGVETFLRLFLWSKEFQFLCWIK